jgi:UDP-N-acetylmuramoylalanine--D-glutamate ligase
VSEGKPENGLVAVIGLARSGRAVAALLARRGHRVYASDAGDDAALRLAAGALRSHGVDVQLGGHDLARIAGARLAVVSPGVPPSATPVVAARNAGVPVLSEVAIALEDLRETRVIAVTGTNGKSTTTALVAHLLEATGRRAAPAGNIGRALSELALEASPPDWVALEVSSFQLHDTPRLEPVVGVLTNLSPDHLDRYPSVADYYADKQLLFAGASDRSRWVTNADDAAVQALAAEAAGSHWHFSLLRPADAWFDPDGGVLNLFGAPLCERRGLRLLGLHNVANALAAVLAVAVAEGQEPDATLRAQLREGLASFTGLPHRLETVGEYGGVVWVNDSKATNVGSAVVAIEAMDRPTVLLLGGRHKGESYGALAGPIREHVRRVIAFGEAAPLIARDLGAVEVEAEVTGSDFAQVIARARAAARSGDAVLLAPACSSYDMFRDYEERGAAFRSLAEET